MRNETTEPKQNKLIKVNRNKNLYTGKKHTSSSIINTNNNTNLLLKNYLNGKINKNGSLSNIKKVNKCKTASVDFQKNLSINKNIVAKHNTINNSDNNTTAKKNTNQLRPVMLYLDQMKYESYFITPNSKRVRKTISSIKNKNISAKSTLPSSFSSGKLHNGISKNSSGINYLKVSKTLTEQNILNMVQNTPKTNKISFISSQSAITKKNLYRNSSSHMTMIKVGKAKTQSALKNKNCEVVYNTNEKDVKQKLLDRMNKAIKGNWNYLYKHKNPSLLVKSYLHLADELVVGMCVAHGSVCLAIYILSLETALLEEPVLKTSNNLVALHVLGGVVVEVVVRCHEVEL